jgi:ATP-dependent RNA helicase DHX37/DHR1
LTAGFLDQVAVRKDIVEKQKSGTRFTTSRGIPYRALGVSEDVYLHPSSILIDSPPPAYLVFNEIVRTSRVYLKGLTVVNPAWLSTLGKGTLCSFSKPMKNNLGIFMSVPMFGPDRWELPAIKVAEHSTSIPESSSILEA